MRCNVSSCRMRHERQKKSRRTKCIWYPQNKSSHFFVFARDSSSFIRTANGRGNLRKMLLTTGLPCFARNDMPLSSIRNLFCGYYNWHTLYLEGLPLFFRKYGVLRLRKPLLSRKMGRDSPGFRMLSLTPDCFATLGKTGILVWITSPSPATHKRSGHTCSAKRLSLKLSAYVPAFARQEPESMPRIPGQARDSRMSDSLQKTYFYRTGHMQYMVLTVTTKMLGFHTFPFSAPPSPKREAEEQYDTVFLNSANRMI